MNFVKELDDLKEKNIDLFNLIANLICPVCKGITSYHNVLCRVEKVVLIGRVCQTCGKEYKFTYNPNHNLPKAVSFFNHVKKYTMRKAHLCLTAKNFVVHEHDKSCTEMDCKSHLKTEHRG